MAPLTPTAHQETHRFGAHADGVATATTTAGTTGTRNAVAHLARRAGFGLHAAAIDALASGGYEAAVDAICAELSATDAAAGAIPPPTFDYAAYRKGQQSSDPAEKQAAAQQLRNERRALVAWWLQRMVAADKPAREKLTFLWHDHFATSLQKVRIAQLMYVQYGTLYGHGTGPFDALVRALAKDPAMLLWLDGRENTSRAPNENFARELFELFTLGHGTHAHHGATDQPYTETDVKEAARALTGWAIDPQQLAGVLVPRRHDAGTKTVLGTTGPLGLDEVVDAAVHDPSCAPHVVARLWSRIGRPAQPDDPVVQDLARPFAHDLDVLALLRRMFMHPEFLSAATRTALVKMPVEYVVGTARCLQVTLAPRHANALVGLGQIPFFPPDVAGWPANAAWLSTSSAQVRLQFALDMAQQADVAPIADARPADRPAAVARTLGVDMWGTATAAALADAAAEPRRMLALALVAPEYLLA
jgi:uncharacterized protein (DUF1800 family)